MSESAPNVPPDSSVSDDRVSSEGRFSSTVSGTLAAVGAGVVLPGDLIDAILLRHANDYLPGSSVREVWARRDQSAEQANGVRQPASQWQAELERLVVPGQRIFGRIAIVALALTDQVVARAAQDTGLLAAQMAEIRENALSLLTDFGVAMLRKRAPIVAFGHGAFAPTVELNTRAEPASTALVAVARQDAVPHGQIGRWALAIGDEVYAGLGSASSTIDGLTAPLALGWYRNGDLLAFRNLGDAGEVVRARMTGVSRSVVTPGDPSGAKWPSARRVIQGVSGTTILSSRGELLWGDPGAVPVDSSASGWTAVAMDRSAARGVRVAGLNDNSQLSAYFLDNSAPPWSVPIASGPDDLIAAGSTHVFHVATNPATADTTNVTVVPWAGNAQNSLQTVAPVPGQPQFLSAGGQYAAISHGRAVTVISSSAVIARRELPAAVIAMDLSPDGEALAVVCADQTLRIWRFTPVDDLSLSSYSNDNPDGPDLLGISPTVDALAALICAKVMAPPLSVGLFGAWGSGKSFFMRKLQARVDEVVEDAQQSGRSQRALWAWRNISQVQFNAWDYSSGDVWAGLLEKLLNELANPHNGRLALPAELDEIKRARLERMVATEAAFAEVSGQRNDAQKKLDEAVRNLSTAQEHLIEGEKAIATAVRQAERRAVGDTLSSLVATALAPVGGGEAAAAIEEVDAQLHAARQRLQSVQGLVRARNGVWIVGALILCPLVAIGLAALVHLFQPSLSGVAAFVGAVTTLLVGFARWVQLGVSWVDKQLEPIEAAERQAAKDRASLIGKVEAAEAARVEAATQLAVAQGAVAERKQELAEAERAVAESTTESLLDEYLTTRSTSTDYRSLLGVLGVVRSDLETISDAVTLHNDQLLRNESPRTDNVVNRIVLYIDDLDRCRPEVVVKVLEAVHLLLSYSLFVVIVAVDAQWVSRSLASVYPSLLTGGDVTPDHYLEKIFQLPMWLDSPSANAASQMLSGLLKPSHGQGGTAPQPVHEEAPAGGDPAASADQEAGQQPDRVVTSEADFATSTPRELELTEAENAHITALAGLVSRSPRAVKRFINTYHLLKVIEGDPAELERVRLLLAIAVGRPILGEQLLSVIMSNQAPGRKLADFMEERPPEDRAWFEDGIVPARASWLAMTSENSVVAARHVHRFVYRARELPVATGTVAVRTPGAGTWTGSLAGGK